MKWITLLMVVGLFFAGCEGTNPIVSADVNEVTVTTNIGEHLITPQYFELDDKIAKLALCINDLALNRTQEKFDAARQCWLEAHAAWERTEAFIFGPASVAALTTNLDSFPVSIPDIRHKLTVTPVFGDKNIPYFSGSIKGFHTIEYFLWDSSGTKQLAQLSDTEMMYMNGVAQDMRQQSGNIRYAWDPNRNDYNKNIREAGKETSEYGSGKEVVNTMLQSMIAASRDLADRKLGGPLAYGVRFEESHFSNSSAADYLNSFLGVRNVYFGGVEEAGLSFATLVREKNYDLDARIRVELQTAIDKITALGPSFATTLATNRQAVIDAQNAIRTVETSLGQVVSTIAQ